MENGSGGGWYNSRKQYRSVAFGTWKPGGASKVFQKSSSNLDRLDDEQGELLQGRLIDPSAHRNHYNTIAVSRGGKAWNGEDLTQTGGRFLSVKLKKMGESSPNLTRIDKTQYQLFPPLRPNETSYSSDAMHRIIIDPRAKAKDCYSSSEYVAYLGRKHSQERIYDRYPVPGGGVGWTDQGGEARDRKARHHLPNSQITQAARVHRSQSAGADASLRVSTDMRSPFTRADPNGNQPGNVKFLRATKKFFKKIYSTATLPKKQSTTSSTLPSTPGHDGVHIQQVQPFFDFSYRDQRFSSDDCDEPYNSSFSTYCSNYRTPVETYRNELNLSTSLHYPKYADSQPDSGVDDRSSTPDESMDSVGAPSSSSPISSTSPSTASSSKDGSNGDEKQLTQIPSNGNWNDVFEQLRREMTLMRERDQQILADLHKVESQLKSVRLANQYPSSTPPYGRQEVEQFRDGPVPSMPI